jgi:DNA repair protein RadD
MIVYRDYQQEAILSLPRYFQRKAGNPLIAMPTGTGKSIVIAGFLQYVFQYPGQKVIIATHVKELIQQNYDKLMAIWPQAPAGIYSSGLGQRDKHNNIIFAGIASIAKRATEFGKIDLFIIDEAHLVSPSEETTYRKVINALLTINPNMKVIGLTATPWRLGHGRITQDGHIFTDICFDITGLNEFNRLISEGYLSPLVPKNPSSLLDTSNVHIHGGEFKQNELQLAVDKAEITHAALKEAMELGHDRNSWLIFAAGVEHAIHIAEMLTFMGIPCKAVHSKMPDKERDEILVEYKAGRLKAVANNNVLTTGFDHPGLDCIVMLRPTASPVLWVQMLGRGTRPVYADGFDLSSVEGRLASIAAGPKQNCLVLDFAGNTKRLGPINDPVIPRKKGDKGGGTAPVKLCMSCATWNHASARFCFLCGSEFIMSVKIKDHADTAQLIKQDQPVEEFFTVDSITYSKHLKKGSGTASIKLSYFCGLRMFNEFVPIETVGAARGIAQRWWNQRTRQIPMPNTVDEALQIVNMLPPATHIKVWTNKQYPEILSHCFDGTNFNRQPSNLKPVPISLPVAPAVGVPWKNIPANLPKRTWDEEENIRLQEEQRKARERKIDEQRARARQMQGIMDDDIPF